MKTSLRFLPGLLGLVSAVVLSAASFEPAKVTVTREPEMPAALRMSGLKEGRVELAIDVSPEGRPVDWLVLAASHRELIRPCTAALQAWQYRPARYDGEPVLAQMRLTIDISQTGSVVSRTPAELIEDFVTSIAGRPMDYQPCPASQIDRPLAPTATVAPRYAAEAAQQGVHGRVRVHFYVDEQGMVRMPAVPAETHPYLSAIAVEAVRSWKFLPPTRQGKPVLVAAVQEFAFDGQ